MSMTWYVCDFLYEEAITNRHADMGVGIGVQVTSGVGTGHFGLLGRALSRALRADRVPWTVAVGWRVHGAPLKSARDRCCAWRRW